MDELSAFSQLGAAIGTILVAVLAIWGDLWREKLAAPKLRLEGHNLTGELTKRESGTRTYYYHLKVVNDRPWSPAKKVRVLLVGLEKKRLADGEFVRQPLIVPLQFVWAHQQWQELMPTFRKEKIVDLGHLDEATSQFQLELLYIPNNFEGFVHASQSIRAIVQAEAENARPSKPLILEISWDGQWTDRTAQMSDHLVVKTK